YIVIVLDDVKCLKSSILYCVKFFFNSVIYGIILLENDNLTVDSSSLNSIFENGAKISVFFFPFSLVYFTVNVLLSIKFVIIVCRYSCRKALVLGKNVLIKSFSSSTSGSFSFVSTLATASSNSFQ